MQGVSRVQLRKRVRVEETGGPPDSSAAFPSTAKETDRFKTLPPIVRVTHTGADEAIKDEASDYLVDTDLQQLVDQSTFLLRHLRSSKEQLLARADAKACDAVSSETGNSASDGGKASQQLETCTETSVSLNFGEKNLIALTATSGPPNAPEDHSDSSLNLQKQKLCTSLCELYAQLHIFFP